MTAILTIGIIGAAVGVFVFALIKRQQKKAEMAEKIINSFASFISDDTKGGPSL